MALVRRGPNRDVVLTDLLESFFDEPYLRPFWRGSGPLVRQDIPLDILEEKDAVVVKASVPGIRPDDLHVEVEDDRLRIWGEVKQDEEHTEDDYYLREHRYGRLERMTTLPCAVDSETADAEIDGGTLILTLPKAAAARRKEIPVQARH